MSPITSTDTVTVAKKFDPAGTRSEVISAGTVYTVPLYVAGLNKIFVYINGTLTNGVLERDKDTAEGLCYYQPGYKYDTLDSIVFTIDIPIEHDIQVIVFDGDDDAIRQDLINVGTIYNTGTTATNFGTITPKVVTRITDTDILNLDGTHASGISHNYRDNNYKTLASSKALYDALMKLESDINEIDPDNVFFRDNSVITLPLIDSKFTRETKEWELNNWYITDDGSAAYSYTTYSNKLTILNDAFTNSNYHFLVVDVERIDSGQLLVVNNANTVLATITTIGKHYIEVDVDDPTIYTLGFVAKDVFPNETIVLSSVYLYRVTDRIRDYLIYAVNSLVSGGGLVSKAELEQIVKDIKTEILHDVNQTISDIGDMVYAHIEDFNNPHNTKYYHVGAAAEVHKHVVTDIIDLEEYVEHAIESGVSTGTDELVNKVDDHIKNYNNPHKVTPVQIGAALKVHTHSISDISDFDSSINIETEAIKKYVDDNAITPLGTLSTTVTNHINNKNNPHEVTVDTIDAAHKDHTHTTANITDLNGVLQTQKQDIIEIFNSHTGNRNNPHGVTPVQIKAAPEEHMHVLADIEDISTINTKLSQFETSLSSANSNIANHVANEENPHNVTYLQLGTGDKGTVFLNTGSTDPVIHVPVLSRYLICETSEEVEKCKNNIPSMKEMFNSWKRISHSLSTAYPDIVTNPGSYPAAPSETLAWEYDETEDVVRNTTNSVSYIGLISPNKYTEYETEIILNAKTNDDDTIAFIAAFTVDESGKEHVLSINRSPGGNSKWEIKYNPSNTETAVIKSMPAPLKWGNGAYGATAAEAGYTQTGPKNPDNTGTEGWSLHPNGTRIYVSRKGNVITAKTTDIGEASGAFVEAATMTIDLSTDARLTKFIKPCSVGYGASSNPYTTWNTVYFRDPSSNIYDASRNVAIVYDSTTNTWKDDTTINIYDALRVGTFGYNYIINKLFFINDGNIERVALNGGGI